MLEFNIPDLASEKIIKEKERSIVANFISIYNVNTIRNVIRNGSCSTMYSIEDLKHKYTKYVASSYSKPQSKRAIVIKKVIEELK